MYLPVSVASLCVILCMCLVLPIEERAECLVTIIEVQSPVLKKANKVTRNKLQIHRKGSST